MIEGWRPYWARTFWAELLPTEGFSGGIYVVYGARHDRCKKCDGQGGTREDGVCMYCEGRGYNISTGRWLYPVLARVLKTYRCEDVKEGDVLRIAPQAFNTSPFLDPVRSPYPLVVMSEQSSWAVVEGFDEAAQAIVVPDAIPA
jgi:hypothetical protein